MPLITASDLTFNGTEVRTFGEAVLAQIFAKPSLESIHTVVDGIVAKQQIAILNRLNKITKTDPGCGLGKLTNAISMSQKFWNPVQLKQWVSECHTQFEGTFMVYMKNKGKDYSDFTQTDIADFIIDLMSDASADDVLRIGWFGDTAALNVSGGGNIKNGVAIADYTQVDGFWKQLFAIVAGDATKRVTITENAGASYAAQDTWGSATAARDYFRRIQTSADYRLQGATDKIILASQSLVNQYADYLETVAVPDSFSRIENGYTIIKRGGVDIIGLNFWDRTIRADFDNGTKWANPHRAVLTTKTNLQIGLDSKAAMGDFDIFYDKMTETANFKGGFKFDAKVIENYMIQVAY
jgi:hypothetical protein